MTTKYKTLIIVASVSFSTIGCGQGFSSPANSLDKQSTENSAAENQQTNNTPAQPNLKTEDINSITSFTNNKLVRFLTNLQGLGGGQFNFTGTSTSISRTLACDGGGTVAFTGQASVTPSVTLTQVTATLSGGSGSLTFTNCKFNNSASEIVTVNGTAALTNVAGSLQVALTSTTQYDFASDNEVAASGSLQIVTPNTTKTCAFTFAAESALTGTIAPAANYSLSATSTTALTATLCGVPVVL